MALSKEDAEALLGALQNNSPGEIFSVLSNQLNIDTQYSSSMSEADLKRLYRKIVLLVHPDKVEETAKAPAAQLFTVVKQAYLHLAFPDEQHSPVFVDIDDRVIELHLLWLRSFRNLEFSNEAVLDLLDALVFPDSLPPECSEGFDLTVISEEIWQRAAQNLDRLLISLQEKERQGLDGKAEGQVFLHRRKIRLLFQHSERLRRAQIESAENLTEQNFINGVVLPEIKNYLRVHRKASTNFPYNVPFTRSISTYVSIRDNLKHILGIGLSQFSPRHNTHAFLRSKTLEERKHLYYSLTQQLESRAQDDKYVDQCSMEIIGSINQYISHYSGFVGSLRFYYRWLFDSDALQVEDRAIEALELSLHTKFIPFLSEGMAFSTEPYDLPKLELPVLNPDQHPFAYALISRLRELNTAYRENKDNNGEQIQTLYKEIANQQPVYQNISREMGTFGLFGTFGRTRTRERCLHTLKQHILSDLINKSDQDPEHTVTVPSETLEILREHNGRFWRFGRTNTQAQFETAFELVAPKDDEHEASYRYRYL